MQNGVDETIEAELRQLMRDLSAGWNSGDATQFARRMTGYTHYVAFDGSVLNGAEEIAAFHQPSYDTHLKGTELQINVTSMRALGTDSFVVLATGGAVRPTGGATELTGDSVQTFLCERIDGELWLTVFQNTRSRPIQGPTSEIIWRSFDTLWETIVTHGGRGGGGGPPGHGGPPPGHG